MSQHASPPLKRRKNPTADTTRDELLNAGYEMLCEEGFDHTIHLRLTEVTKRAGRTTGAAYQIWPRQHMYHRDLAQFTLQHEAVSAVGAIQKAIDKLGANPSLDDVIAVGSAAYVSAQLNDRMFQAYVRYWSAALTDDVIKESMQVGFNQYQHHFDDLYRSLLDQFGLEPKPPYTVDDIVTAIGCVTDGFTFQCGIDADRNRVVTDDAGTSRDLLARTIGAVVDAMTRKARKKK